MTEITINNRKGKKFVSLDISDKTTVGELKKLIFKTRSKYYPSRQYLTIQTTQLDKKGRSKRQQLLDDEYVPLDKQVTFKDLGPQIGWTTVFLCEYGGPIFIFAIFYLFPNWFHSSDVIAKGNKEYTTAQIFGFWCVIGHYLKREFETLFIHRFSNGTMPIFNIFKNCGHYWVLCGNIGYFLFHPLYTQQVSDDIVYICTGLFIVSQFGNLYSHIILRNLRPPGTRIRAIPKGFLFNYVSCSNYTFEILCWTLFCVFTATLSGWIFLLASAGQMAIWAMKKHKKYRKEFKNYPKNRKALIPFLW